MTRSDRAVRLLRTRSDLARLATFPFDFDVDRAEHGEAVHLASGAPLEAVAGDDTGGTYFVCTDESVLYASSEGEAGLVADSVDEALEVLIGLPGWRDYTILDPHADDAMLTAAVARAEDDLRASYAPALDADRNTLLAGLGLRHVPQPALIRRLHEALLRTEPDFLLLNADEGCAYTLLDRMPHPPLWHTVLAPGLADLALLRTSHDCWFEVASDPARRATVLRAAQYDRQETDLPLLRVLLQHEARYGATEELRLAAVLVGRHGQPEDHELLTALRETNPDVHYVLGSFPPTAQRLADWAADFDASNYGDDPADEHELTWAELARRQGRTELTRCTLIRLLDDAGPRDAPLLARVAGELAQLGDFTQAARARHLYASLQDDPLHRGSALADLASLQRRAGNVEAAWRSLQLAVSILNGPPPPPATNQLMLDLDLDLPEPETLGWRALGVGQRIAAEHFHTARAAAQAGLSVTAHASLTAGTALIQELPCLNEDLRQMSIET
ncbi:hypothetical protein P3T27_006917 [Kitasatospora sp. MAA19]|uniref:hypothetical protein n=1 Tax=unclassified Kitasatospora TaxID=2633591 RepID=UPI0024767F7F|nr:hypothetical protein [Kitasatospora sp. MAA19]MDH6710168.1 hypothetical protein [Kitasatospora sp. MAA19]